MDCVTRYTTGSKSGKDRIGMAKIRLRTIEMIFGYLIAFAVIWILLNYAFPIYEWVITNLSLVFS